MLYLTNLIFLYQIILTVLLFLSSSIFSGLIIEYTIPLLFIFVMSATIYFITKRGNSFKYCQISICLPSKLILQCFFFFFIALNFSEFIFVATHGGHQALYMADRPLFPFLIFKLLAFPAFYFATIIILTKNYVVSRLLVWLALFSPLLTGSRGMTIFLLLAYLFVTFGPFFFIRFKFAILGFLMIISFIGIGYYREPINMSIADYIILVVSSLNEFAFASMNISNCQIPFSNVFTQFGDIFLGAKSDFRVATLLTECVSPGASEKGYGISSSIVGESKILGDNLWFLYFIAILSINSIMISILLRSGSRLSHMVGISLLPFILYSVRTEIVYPYVFLIKILIYILIAMIINQILVKSSAVNYKQTWGN